MILQPNVGEENVRRWLLANNYQITAEYIMEEDGHICEVIAASYTDEKQTLTQEELQFGPYLLQKKMLPFKLNGKKEIAKLETILKRIE